MNKKLITTVLARNAIRPVSASVCLLSCLLVSVPVYATNGYFPHGMGTKNKAMAGAGMALPEDPIAVVNNPAVAVFLGNKMDAGLTVFMPNRNFSALSDGSDGQNDSFSFDVADIDSNKDLYLLPEIAGTHQLQNDSAFAFAFYTRGGIGTSLVGGGATFDPDGSGPLPIENLAGIYGDGKASFDLYQALVDLGWAKKMGDNTAFGVSAVLAAQSLKITGTGGLARYTKTFAENGGLTPDHLSNNGSDVSYGAGLKVGLHHNFGEHFSVGVMYQSEIRMGSLDKYSDFLAKGGEFDIPSSYRLGISWKPTDSLSFSIDAQQILYSKIATMGNSFENIYDCPGAGYGGSDPESCLGGKRGAGFAWKDVPVYSFGGSWAVSSKWTLRAGMGISNQPVEVTENFLNSLLIDLNEASYTAGFTYKLDNGQELGFAFMYSEEESLEAPNQLDAQQRVLITNDQFDFQVSYRWGK
jgi:long-chain fatty acid transport protein